MTEAEKLTALQEMLSPDTDTDEVLTHMLRTAEAMILNRMYPFGCEDTVALPRRYEQIQLQLAVELYSKRGAEGQTGHSENGISRTWSEDSPLLKRIMPHCGGVKRDA